MDTEKIAQDYVARFRHLDANELRAAARVCRDNAETAEAGISMKMDATSFRQHIEDAVYQRAVADAFEAAAAKLEKPPFNLDGMVFGGEPSKADNFGILSLLNDLSEYLGWEPSSADQQNMLKRVDAAIAIYKSAAPRPDATAVAAAQMDQQPDQMEKAREFVATFTTFTVADLRKAAQDNRNWGKSAEEYLKQDPSIKPPCTPAEHYAAAKAFDEAADEKEREQAETEQVPDLLTAAKTALQVLRNAEHSSRGLSVFEHECRDVLQRAVTAQECASTPTDSMTAYCTRMGVALPTTELPTEPGYYWARINDTFPWQPKHVFKLPHRGDELFSTLDGSRELFVFKGYEWIGPIPLPPASNGNGGDE